MDEVDRILQAWRTEAPHLDASPLRVFSRVSRLARHLDLARKEAFAGHGLEVWEFDVLAALRREGAPYELSPGALIHQTLSTSGTMTNRIDRLAARGMVERLPDPRDRRGVRVRLTEPGAKVVDAALADLISFERDLLGALTCEQSDEIAVLLRKLLAGFEAAWRGDDQPVDSSGGGGVEAVG
ncbi:MarR family winged helix-turn-helix transcriptional regulator [Nigerium massiliense]|uniref:MarR family winged helix-turn-helix transcriptional regulator n=1 Tax=Nigerium massiliense TaxID=1522317 RepID=UPI00090792A3|nr:MarR family transcriptional regulator [Nigerium massiliense]